METITTVLLPWTMAIKTEKKKEDQEGGANGFGTLFFGIIAIAYPITLKVYGVDFINSVKTPQKLSL